MRVSWRFSPLPGVFFVVVATSLLWAWQPVGGQSNTQLSQPLDIAVAEDGSLVIVDGDRVLRRHPDGATDTLLDRSDGFRVPKDVSIGEEGKVYVADLAGVIEVSRSGRHRRVLQTPTTCVVADAAGALLVCDDENSEVRRVDRDGSTLGTFPFLATSVAVDGQGNVYIAHRDGIARLTKDGSATTLATAASSGPSATNPGLLTEPTDIVVDRRGDVLVADSGSLRLVSAAGQVTTVVDRRATAAGRPAFSASGVAVGPDDQAVVTDVFNKVIYRVSPEGRLSLIAGGFPRSRVNSAALAVADVEPFGRRAALAVAAAVAVAVSRRHRERWRLVVLLLAACAAAAGLVVLVVGGVLASFGRGQHAAAGAFFIATGVISAWLMSGDRRASPRIAAFILGVYVVVNGLVAQGGPPESLAAGMLASVSFLAGSVVAEPVDRTKARSSLALAAAVAGCAYTGAVIVAPATSGARELVMAGLLIGVALAAARNAIGRNVLAAAFVVATIGAIALLPYALIGDFYDLSLSTQKSVGELVLRTRASPLIDLGEPWLYVGSAGANAEEYDSERAFLFMAKGAGAITVLLVVVIALVVRPPGWFGAVAGAVFVEVVFAITTTSLSSYFEWTLV